MKTKIKSHGDEVKDFNEGKIRKLDSNHIYLAVISLEYTLKKDENYYSQVLFIIHECKYIEGKVLRTYSRQFELLFSFLG